MNLRSSWLLVLLVLLASSCDLAIVTPQTKNGVYLSLSDADRLARTILPALPAGSLYVVTVEHYVTDSGLYPTPPYEGPDPYVEPLTFKVANFGSPIGPVFNGQNRVSATLQDAGGQVIGQSDALTAWAQMGQSNPISLTFHSPSPVGTGSLHVVAIWPVSSFGALAWELQGYPSGPVIDSGTAAAGGTISVDQPTLVVGNYQLTLTPFTSVLGSAIPEKVRTEIVQIWPNLPSTATVSFDTTQFGSLPAAPSDVVATPTSNNVRVTWRDNSNDETGFNVYLGSSTTPIATTGPGVNLCTIAPTDAGTFDVTVKALGQVANSAASVSASFGYPRIDVVTVPAQSAVTIGAVVITQIDAQPVHPVASLASFELGKTELTYGVWYLVYQWAVVHGYSLSAGKDSNSQTGGAANAKLPVVMIAWHDAIVWCNALSELKGLRPVYYSDVGQTTVIRSVDALSSPGSSNDPYLDKTSGGYHLPTEAQWESAARYVDGVITAADDLASGAATASSADFDTVGWFAPTNSTVQLVGLKLANPLGLFDMSGNVSEFCQDWFGAYTLSSPYIDADTWGPTTGTERVFRGASTTGIDSLSSQLMYGATTYRWKVLPTFTPNSPSEQRGFRVARNP